MADFLAENWFVGIVFTIFLGALGSALWEAALKPISRKAGSILFKVLSFNAQRAKDRVYINAAMGHHELASLYVLCFIYISIACIVLMPMAAFYLAIYTDYVASDIPIADYCESVRGTTQYKKCMFIAAKEKLGARVYIYSAVGVFVSANLMYRFLSVNKTNLVVTYFEQVMRCVRPYLTTKEALLYEQKFALMEKQQDYNDIIDDLGRVASENDITLPEKY